VRYICYYGDYNSDFVHLSNNMSRYFSFAQHFPLECNLIFFSFQLFLSLSVCRYPHFVTSELFKLLNDIRHRYKLNNKQYKMLVITQLNIMPLKKSSLDTFVFYVVLILCYFPMFLNLVFMGTNTKTKMTQKWNLYASIVWSELFHKFNFVLLASSDLRSAIVKRAKKQKQCSAKKQINCKNKTCPLKCH